MESLEDYSFDSTVNTSLEVGINILAVASGPSIHILNLCNKQVTRTLDLHSDDVLTFAKVQSNLPIMISAGKDKTIMVWKLTSGEVLAKVQTSLIGSIVSSLIMKKSLILASFDHTISLWDIDLKSAN